MIILVTFFMIYVKAQVSAALRPQFSLETSAHVTAKACHVCSRWISSGIARDLNDLRRVHQLLVSSLQKLSGKQSSENGVSSSENSGQQFSMQNTVSNDQLIYSELSLTIEKLAVLRGWAEVYIVAKHKSSSLDKRDNTNTLLALVQPELAVLSYHWYVALKDYAFLCLPNGGSYLFFFFDLFFNNNFDFEMNRVRQSIAD